MLNVDTVHVRATVRAPQVIVVRLCMWSTPAFSGNRLGSLGKIEGTAIIVDGTSVDKRRLVVVHKRGAEVRKQINKYVIQLGQATYFG